MSSSTRIVFLVLVFAMVTQAVDIGNPGTRVGLLLVP